MGNGNEVATYLFLGLGIWLLYQAWRGVVPNIWNPGNKLEIGKPMRRSTRPCREWVAGRLRNGTTRHPLRETTPYWRTVAGLREIDSDGPCDICVQWAAKSVLLAEQHQERKMRRLAGGGCSP